MLFCAFFQTVMLGFAYKDTLLVVIYYLVFSPFQYKTHTLRVHDQVSICTYLVTSINNESESPDSSGNNGVTNVSVSKVTDTTSSQNVHFTDGDSPWMYDIDSSLDSTYELGGADDADLGNFLSRPLLIKTYQWTPGAQLFQTFNPWSLYFANVAVNQKLTFYRNFRCSLRIKIVVNGNSFYYGRALLSYNPYLTNDNVTRNRAFYEQDIVQASQKPHVLLDPCSSQGAEMSLPYIWPENWLDITSSGWEDDMGECTIHDFDVLQHANGGTDPISVNIFAWPEDVRLCIPTTAAAQAGPSKKNSKPKDAQGYPKVKPKGKKKSSNTTKLKQDEFKKDGLVSKPASAIASAANALSMIPVIAPYAKATEMIATKVGQIARLFGYSRPQVVTDISPYVPRYLGNLSNTDSPEALTKLSLDSKNELSIDSRLVGLSGEDELTILSIASRPSYLFQFPWAESATTGSRLASIRVDPTAVRTVSAAPVREIHQTAISFATAPFKYWQGSIKYRFVVVASEYHRGRLQLTFDLNQNTTSDFNKSYSTVVDISETRDFEYEVKWSQKKAWLEVRDMDTAATTQVFATGGISEIPNNTFTSGVVNIYCLNELATPSTTAADVKVLCFISAGDDYAVAVPKSLESFNTLSVFEEQAGEDMVSAQDTSNAPDCSDVVPTFDVAHIMDDEQYLVYMGERVVSFRDVLKRYYYHTSYRNEASGTAEGFRIYIIQNFPAYYGWDPNGRDSAVDSTTGTAAFNFMANTMLNYLTPAFACRRGGIRSKYMQCGTIVEENSIMMVTRNDDPAQNATQFLTTGGTSNAQRHKVEAQSLSCGSGAIATPTAVNPCIEAEFPFYTAGQRFVAARDTAYNTSREHAAHRLITTANGSATNGESRVDRYIAAAEDFNLSFFVGAPIIFSYDYPTAV